MRAPAFRSARMRMSMRDAVAKAALDCLDALVPQGFLRLSSAAWGRHQRWTIGGPDNYVLVSLGRATEDVAARRAVANQRSGLSELLITLPPHHLPPRFVRSGVFPARRHPILRLLWRRLNLVRSL